MYIICAMKHCFTEQRIYTFSLGVWCIKASSAPMNIVMITCHADTTSYKRLPYHWPFVWGIHRESTFLFTCMSSYNRKKQNETSKQKKLLNHFGDYHFMLLQNHGNENVRVWDVASLLRMMTSWHGYAFRIIGPMWGESTISYFSYNGS